MAGSQSMRRAPAGGQLAAADVEQAHVHRAIRLAETSKANSPVMLESRDRVKFIPARFYVPVASAVQQVYEQLA